ncbi:hypothetical protein RBWH47_04941 [Rhodopirellula baltica WH47]|uniref:Uncharacterized protein n=1 Tax=Rhodopirellula baltica WH47 TaxID=991778 RepID=F2AYY6_RHOBT|nr:hypothetical protein RBWH47_04941 [Rhodopirellula baltica WH47]
MHRSGVDTFSDGQLYSRRQVTADDYEVLGLTSGFCHVVAISLFTS